MSETYPITVLVVDDEQPAREGLRDMLCTFDGLRVVGEAGSGSAALDRIRQTHPDAVFLDVQMPGLSGFDVIENLSDADMPMVVFVTAFDRHAVRAFEEHAVDFLLKPFSDDRLRRSVERLRERCRDTAMRVSLQHQVRALLDMNRREKAKPRRIAVPNNGKTTFVELGDVRAVRAAGNYVEIHTVGRPLLLRSTLTAIEEQLADNEFVRIHRSTIVNRERIAEMIRKRSGGCQLILDSGLELSVSRSYADKVPFVS
ncbi:MAG: response regulator transcription factor [Bacteroidetes bacterium]|nr:response regulator transcription factor [Bacteroidota bacterium]